MSSLRPRILTGLALAPLVLLVIFTLPDDLFLVVALAVIFAAAVEMVRMFRFWAPEAPYTALLVLLPAVTLGAAWAIRKDFEASPLQVFLVVWGVMVLAAALVVLWGRTEIANAAVAMAFMAFALPYFAAPVLALDHLHRVDPWLVLLLVAMVGGGDTAAFFVGSRIGRHKMSLRVSPKKSWEGAIASWLTAIGLAALWAWYREGAVHGAWLVAAAVVAPVAQLGDLVESLVKRGAGVKDSANLLPGHGGVYDRIDALLLAAPVFVLVLWGLGLPAERP